MPDETQYAQLLLEWNERASLSGARTMAELAPHLADARGFLELSWNGVSTVVDIGSGGGLPAIPLALALPEVRFTLVEANRRKVAFLEHAAGRLGLRNIVVVAGRAEDLATVPPWRDAFDRATSRAAARPAVLLELALPFVRTGGDLLASVGEVDLAALTGAAAELGGEELWVHRTRAGRSILCVRKRGATPARFPRRSGVAIRRPLA